MRVSKRQCAAIILCTAVGLVVTNSLLRSASLDTRRKAHTNEWLEESSRGWQPTSSQLLQIISSHQSLFPLPSPQCPVLRPALLIFMRIPKCASTSFVELLKQLSKSERFYFSFNPRGAFDWDDSEKVKVARYFEARADWVHAEHLYLVDFREFGLRNYTYVAIVREPVSRVVSSYLYYHFSSKRHIQAMLNPLVKNESITDCLRNKHSGCEHNLMTKYFCGHEAFCTQNGSRALIRAKQNLRSQFAVVGVLEHMDITMKLLRAVLPRHFGSWGSESVPLVNKNEKLMTLTSQIRDAILKVNALDLELYQFAHSLLQKQAALCGIT